MINIKKVDYYCGSFLSYLISNGMEQPVLFDADTDSKIITFMVKNKEYKAYIKYVVNKDDSYKKIKNSYWNNWVFNFSLEEVEKLYNNFKDTNSENLIVLVCADKKFKKTIFATLTLEQAMKCLGVVDGFEGKQRTITVRHQKGSNYIKCHGTGRCIGNPIERKRDCDEYFGFTE